MNTVIDSDLPLSHWTAAFPWYPGRHSHIMVLTGYVSNTWHIVLIPHGTVALQGLTHSLLMQAVCDGQSESSSHLVSTEKVNWSSNYFFKFDSDSTTLKKLYRKMVKLPIFIYKQLGKTI